MRQSHFLPSVKFNYITCKIRNLISCFLKHKDFFRKSFYHGHPGHKLVCRIKCNHSSCYIIVFDFFKPHSNIL